MSEKCSICKSGHAWEIDNAYLAESPKKARELAEALGVSKAAYYRHIKSHLPLHVDPPPEDPRSLNWTRAAISLIKAVEAYSLIKEPEAVSNIAVVAGSDPSGQFVALLVEFLGDAINWAALNRLSEELGLIIEHDQSTVGPKPFFRVVAKLYAPSISMGRRTKNERHS